VTSMLNNYLSSLTGKSLILTHHNLISQVTGPNKDLRRQLSIHYSFICMNYDEMMILKNTCQCFKSSSLSSITHMNICCYGQHYSQCSDFTAMSHTWMIYPF